MNVFLAGCLALTMALSDCQRGHVIKHTERAKAQQVAKDCSYPESPAIIRVESPYEAQSLAGRISDPTSAGLEKVLVQRLSSGWKKCIDATFTDSEGSFSFSQYSGKTQFLRISKPGFNTLLIKVKIKDDLKPLLSLKLGASH
jgi:hypothetical protein